MWTLTSFIVSIVWFSSSFEIYSRWWCMLVIRWSLTTNWALYLQDSVKLEVWTLIAIRLFGCLSTVLKRQQRFLNFNANSKLSEPLFHVFTFFSYSFSEASGFSLLLEMEVFFLIWPMGNEWTCFCIFNKNVYLFVVADWR